MQSVPLDLPQLAVTPMPMPTLVPATGDGAAATGSNPAGSASHRLAGLQRRHAQLLADTDAADRARLEAQAAAKRAEEGAAAALQRQKAAEEAAEQQEAALAAAEAAAQERLAALEARLQEQQEAEQGALRAAATAQREAAAAGQQLESVQ